MSERSSFIAIEGGDGSGKGTQSELLATYAREALGRHVMKLSFPRYDKDSALYVGRYLDGQYGESADAVHPDLASLTYAIDRYAASSDIQPILDRPNGLVIADRYVASNLAHQGTKFESTAQRHQFYDEMKHLEFDILGIPRPDLSIVLIMPTELAQANVDKKATRSYTAKQRDLHEQDTSHLDRAKANYEELCLMYPNEFVGIQCVNADGTMRSIADIQAEIRQLAGLS